MRCRMCKNKPGMSKVGTLRWISPRGVEALLKEVSVGFLNVASRVGAVVLSIASASPSFLACHYDAYQA